MKNKLFGILLITIVFAGGIYVISQRKSDGVATGGYGNEENGAARLF